MAEFSLPHQLSEWRGARKRFGCEHMDIHNLVAPNSGSLVNVEQFLALKVIWVKQKQRHADKYLTSIGFEEGVFDKRRNAMMAREAWKCYLDMVDDNHKADLERRPFPWTLDSEFPDRLGGFQSAFDHQLEIQLLSKESNNADVEKVTVSSMPGVSPMAPVTPRLERLRPRMQNFSYAPPEPETPQRPSVFRPTVDMSARKNEQPNLPKATDESIVNTALVDFLKAVWVDEKRRSGWSLEKKAFHFHPQGTGIGFTALTDGHLRVTNRSAAILEVKARVRPRTDPGNHKIEMQESAQMALWIAQEPESHWTSPASTTSTDVRNRQGAKQTIY